MPDGSTAEEMNEKVLQIDAFLANFSEIKRFTTNVSPGNAQIYVTFKDEFINTAFPFTLENQVVRKMESIGGADWRTFGVSQRGYSISLGVDSKTNRIEITGYNYDRLTQIAENLIIELEKNKRVADVEVETNIEFRHPSLREKRQEMHIKYDPKSLAIYDFNPSQGYSELSSRLSVTSGGRYTNGGNNTDISLVSSQASKFNKWKLLNSYIPVNGTSTRYSHFGEIGVRKAKSVIKKENQEYSIEVGFNYNGNYKLAEEFMKKTIAGLNKSLPIGFRTANTSYGHYNDNGSQYLLLFIIAVIIFFVCSILFESIRQPMVIIALIPLSYIGTFLIFPLTGINFGNGGFASLVLLSGLVVNAAIYIINEYNNTRQVSGRDLIKIYVKAFNHKIIPIILTVVSTVLGLLPFLVDKVKEEFWYSFAIGTISGLLFSVIALVLFMPILMPLKVGQPLVVPDR